MRSGSKWPKIGPRPCAYACAYVDPVFTCQSYDISANTRRTNLSIFLVLMLRLMSTQFSLAYTCACAYGYALVKTRLNCQYSQDEIDSCYEAPVKELTLYVR